MPFEFSGLKEILQLPDYLITIVPSPDGTYSVIVLAALSWENSAVFPLISTRDGRLETLRVREYTVELQYLTPRSKNSQVIGYSDFTSSVPLCERIVHTTAKIVFPFHVNARASVVNSMVS